MRITGTVYEVLDKIKGILEGKELETLVSFLHFYKEDTPIELSFEQTSIGTVIKVTTPPLDITDYTSW